MSYRKPNGLLKDVQQKRITPKSSFLKKLEKQQQEAAEEAKRREQERAEKVTQFRREVKSS